jgi:hypothetical protein
MVTASDHLWHAGVTTLTATRTRGTLVSRHMGKGAMFGRESSGRIGRLLFASPALLLFVIALALAGGALAPAHAANWLEKNFWLSGPNYSRDMPPCDYPPAIDRVINDFHTKEARFWNSGLQIVGIEDIRQSAYLPWAAQSIPRRFCSGTALINNGRRHRVYYSIATGLGMIGSTWGVNFCVVGYDRDWAYGPDCRAAKP